MNVALTDHPFLKGVNRFANSIFESYLYARALRGDFGNQLEKQVTDVLLKSTSLAAMLLAEFYLRTDNIEVSLQHRVKPEHLGILYDSLLSSESSQRRVRLSIDGANPCDSAEGSDSDADGEFELSLIDREHEVEYEPQIITFSLRKCLKSVLGSGSNVDMGAPKLVFHEQREISKRPERQRMATLGTVAACSQTSRPADQIPAQGGGERYSLCVAHRMRMANAPSRPASVAHHIPLLPHMASRWDHGADS